MTSETRNLNLSIFKRTIPIYMTMCIIILFITKLNIASFRLFTVGACGSLLNFFLLSISIEKTLNPARNKSKRRAVIWPMIRMVILFEVIVFIMDLKHSQMNIFNLVILVLGLLIVQLSLVISAFKNNLK